MVLQITPWERDALQLLAAGVADDEIAAMLAISEGTVNSYLAYLFEKLGVTSRSEAVMAATAAGWCAGSNVQKTANVYHCSLLNVRPAEMPSNRDRDVAGVSRRGPVDESGTLKRDHGGIAVAMHSRNARYYVSEKRPTDHRSAGHR